MKLVLQEYKGKYSICEGSEYEGKFKPYFLIMSKYNKEAGCGQPMTDENGKYKYKTQSVSLGSRDNAVAVLKSMLIELGAGNDSPDVPF